MMFEARNFILKIEQPFCHVLVKNIELEFFRNFRESTNMLLIYLNAILYVSKTCI